MSAVVGIDLGGTNLRVAGFASLDATDGDGVPAPIAVVRHALADRSVDAVIERIAAAVGEVSAALDGKTVPVGIGLAGMLADRRGTIANAPNLGWRDVGFGPRLAARLGGRHPVGVYNDVNAIAFGEHGLGAGRGARDLLAVFVGTGVGGGLVVSGALAEGATSCAGELGHVKVAWGPDAAPCGCGARGCVEAYAGGVHLVAQVRAALARGESPGVAALASADDAHPGHVDRAAAAGDPWAQALWTRTAQLLAVAIGNAITLLNPDRLVLGGGVLSRAPALRARTIEALAAIVPPALLAPVTIVDAALGDDGGLLGAALLATAGVSMTAA